jgi:hypothetical protein
MEQMRFTFHGGENHMRMEILAFAFGVAMLAPLGAWAQPSLHPTTEATSAVTLVQDRHERRERCRHDRHELKRERDAERAERRAGHRHEAAEIHERVVALRHEVSEHCH